jgi:hypothetical protein
VGDLHGNRAHDESEYAALASRFINKCNTS